MRNFDYKKLKDIKWDSEILGLVAQIHEYKGKQTLFLKQKPATLEKLVDIAKIQSTEASNKIEGIVTTATRIKQLYSDKIFLYFAIASGIISLFSKGYRRQI